jgi:hypothetical protein
MRKNICHVVLLISIFFASPLAAQISAQGQGGKDVIWLAAGIDQKIGKRWTNKNVIAYSRHSGLSNWEAIERLGIWTVREEVYYSLSKHFKIAQGVFYAGGYYDTEQPNYLNEVRLYPKLYHEFSFKKVKFSHYLRTDFRFFSEPGFKPYDKPLEIRNRYLMKVTVPLDGQAKNYFIGMTELFFATDEKREENESAYFTAYQFTENRSSFYFRHHISNLNAFIDAGVMLQTWKDSRIGQFRETYILQVDIVFINPFSR